jgi:hypothetical protein
MKLLLLVFFLAGFLIVTPFRDAAKLGRGDWLILGVLYAVAAGFAALALRTTRDGQAFFGMRRTGWIIGMAVTYAAGLVLGILQSF